MAHLKLHGTCWTLLMIFFLVAITLRCIKIMSEQEKRTKAAMILGEVCDIAEISELCSVVLWLVVCLVFWVVFLSISVVHQILGSVKRN